MDSLNAGILLEISITTNTCNIHWDEKYNIKS